MSEEHRQHDASTDGRSSSEDLPLYSSFADLRRVEETQAPEFASLLSRPTHAYVRRGRRLVLAICAIAAVLVVVLLRLRLNQPRQDAVMAASIMEWRSPTDFLLETPGRELLRGVPEFGEWRGLAAFPLGRPSPAKEKTASSGGRK